MTRAEREQRHELVRDLRYMDGLTCGEVGGRVGLTREWVQKIAPGRPGKVDNAKLRDAFLQSGHTAAGVALRLGWTFHRDGHEFADGGRLKKVLGILDTLNGRGHRSRRRFIDAETAMLIAEAIGREPWEFGLHDA